jgi:hypothetical protein
MKKQSPEGQNRGMTEKKGHIQGQDRGKSLQTTGKGGMNQIQGMLEIEQSLSRRHKLPSKRKLLKKKSR